MKSHILQAWIGAQSSWSQFCWFMLWSVEISEKNVLALVQMTHKPVCWFRYVDYTFVTWLHGKETLKEFLNHLSGLQNKIQFTMGGGGGGGGGSGDHLPFLDIGVCRKTEGSLGHSPLGAHPYQSLPTPKKSNSCGFSDTQGHSSLWPGFHHPRTGISHYCFQW
jgi:hypothetical protein